MKKLFLLLPFTLFFINCNSDDDSSNGGDDNPTENIFLKKLTNTILYDSDGTTETHVFEFEYNSENKLSRLISETGYTEFEYENGRISSYSNYEDSNVTSDGTLHYENDRLSYMIAHDAEYTFRIDYTYLNDGKLIRFNQCSGTEPCIDDESYTEFNYDDDNIVERINHYLGGSSTTYNFSFDEKKNPFSNYDLPTRILLNDAFGLALSKNNYISQTDYSEAIVNYVNTYNSDDYITIQDGRYADNSLYMKNEYEYVELD